MCRCRGSCRRRRRRCSSNTLCTGLRALDIVPGLNLRHPIVNLLNDTSHLINHRARIDGHKGGIARIRVARAAAGALERALGVRDDCHRTALISLRPRRRQAALQHHSHSPALTASGRAVANSSLLPSRLNDAEAVVAETASSWEGPAETLHLKLSFSTIFVQPAPSTGSKADGTRHHRTSTPLLCTLLHQLNDFASTLPPLHRVYTPPLHSAPAQTRV